MNYILLAASFLSFAYSATILFFWVGIERLKREVPRRAKPCRKLSVVIPFRNEAENINRLLKSISEQHYPVELFEIILVNDHSTDEWQPIVNKWSERLPNLRLINSEPGRHGKKGAIDKGIQLSENLAVALTDADCIVPNTWLSEIAAQFSSDDTALVFGPVTIQHNNSFSTMQALEHSSLQASAIGAGAMKASFMASSANLAFDKGKIGYSLSMLNPNQPSGDDVFLLHAAIKKGLNVKPLINEGMLVTTLPQKNIRAFLFQRARWASKAKEYRNIMAVWVAVLVFILNLVIVSLGVGLLFNINLLVPLLVLVILKLITDYILLSSYLKHIKQEHLLRVFVPLQLIYPFYIVITALFSAAMPTKWK